MMGLGWMNFGEVVQFQDGFSIESNPKDFVNWQEDESIFADFHSIAPIAASVMVDEAGATFGAAVIDEPTLDDSFEFDFVGIGLAELAGMHARNGADRSELCVVAFRRTKYMFLVSCLGLLG